MEYNPIKILTEAIRKVPFIKYALAIAGIASAIAIIKSFNLESNGNFPVISILIMFSIMILLFVFSSFTKSQVLIIKYSGYALVFSTVFVFIMSSLLLVSCAFFNIPKSPSDIFGGKINSTYTLYRNKKSLIKAIGGKQVCEYQVSFEIINANITFKENETLDSDLYCSYLEKSPKCKIEPKNKLHKYSLSDYRTFKDSIIIFYSGEVDNTPKCDLIFRGIKSENHINGTYTWIRSDNAITEVLFTIDIRVQLYVNKNS